LYTVLGDAIDELGSEELEVVAIGKNKRTITFKFLKVGWGNINDEEAFTRTDFAESFNIVSAQKPFPLKEDGV
jgi:hypothetical protein